MEWTSGVCSFCWLPISRLFDCSESHLFCARVYHSRNWWLSAMQRKADLAPLKEDMPRLFNSNPSVAQAYCWKTRRSLQRLDEVPVCKIGSVHGIWVKNSNFVLS